jgi:hypothetical protein
MFPTQWLGFCPPTVEGDLINSCGINARAILQSEAIACKRFAPFPVN